MFEHLASAGDVHLGGENLLEHLAYRVFCANLDPLRERRIHFTRPPDAEVLPGTEALVQPTQAAQTNTVMLVARLRPFWEGDSGADLPGQLALELLDADGRRQGVELAVDAEALEAFLTERIGRGVDLFLAELARAFADRPPAPIHVLLAGNASRARHVRAAFALAAGEGEAVPEEETAAWTERLRRAFGAETPPEVVVHPPLPIDPDRPFAPTAKTGVALGLLRLAPGAGVKLVDHVRARHGDEAPFGWFVGRLRRGAFQPVLDPDTPYGAWRELGPVPGGVFNLCYTASARARAGLRDGDEELRIEPVEWPEARPGARLWARALGQAEIELGLAEKGREPAADDPVQRLRLVG